MEKIIEVDNLVKYFPLRRGFFGGGKAEIKAVDGVSFYIKKGETFGLVGESGCGKSTIARTLSRIYDRTGGKIVFMGMDFDNLSKQDEQRLRKNIQMIFQDPYTSLNPRMTIKDIIEEPFRAFGLYSPKEREERVFELLATVGLNKEHITRYSHEFSGGQRQRIGIARALALNPELIICDEPISALDVSIQAQIVNRLKTLQEQRGLTYLFIAHDLSMVKYISDRVGVMYLGSLLEVADSGRLYQNRRHPYTRALLSAIPIADPVKADQKKPIELSGDIPSPINKPCGCGFHKRCPQAFDECARVTPELIEIETDYYVACHLYKNFT